jgi:hypothetical protein
MKRIKYEFGPTKVCSRCKVEKPRSEYYEGDTKSGLHYWCKQCYCEYQRERWANRAARRLIKDLTAA